MAAEIAGQRARKSDHSAFGCHIVGQVGHAKKEGDRANVDDGSLLLFHQDGSHGPSTVKGSVEIDIHHLVPIAVGHFQDMPARIGTLVVH